MSNLLKTISVASLKRAAELREQIEKLENELSRLAGGAAPAASAPPRAGNMSAAGRARIAAAQRLRWAKFHAANGPAQAPKKAKRTLSPEGRARIIAAQKARWAKAKAAQG